MSVPMYKPSLEPFTDSTVNIRTLGSEPEMLIHVCPLSGDSNTLFPLLKLEMDIQSLVALVEETASSLTGPPVTAAGSDLVLQVIPPFVLILRLFPVAAYTMELFTGDTATDLCTAVERIGRGIQN